MRGKTKHDPALVATFADRMQQAMNERGMSQRELGRRIGVSQASVHYYLIRNKVPTMTTAVKVANALDVSLDWLFGTKEKPDEEDVWRLKKIAQSVVEGTRDTYACINSLNKCARALVRWAEKYDIDLEEDQ